jgi:hypothetical protein
MLPFTGKGGALVGSVIEPPDSGWTTDTIRLFANAAYRKIPGTGFNLAAAFWMPGQGVNFATILRGDAAVAAFDNTLPLTLALHARIGGIALRDTDSTGSLIHAEILACQQFEMGALMAVDSVAFGDSDKYPAGAYVSIFGRRTANQDPLGPDWVPPCSPGRSGVTITCNTVLTSLGVKF